MKILAKVLDVKILMPLLPIALGAMVLAQEGFTLSSMLFCLFMCTGSSIIIAISQANTKE